MNNSVAFLGFEPPQVIVSDTPEKEEDLEEDPKEVENTEEHEDSDDSRDSTGSDEPKYHQDLEDLEPWDF